MTIEEKANLILEKARAWAEEATSWVDFSNKLFADPGGLIPKTFPRMTERKQFFLLRQHEDVNSLLEGLIRKYGIDDGRAKKKSGKFLVRLPKTLHNALDIEAQSEGVSLNQLAAVKLAVPLKDPDAVTKSRVVEAFTRVYDGYSTDRVIVHPELNDQFLRECKKLGLLMSDYELNHLLQDIRKSGNADLPPAVKKPKINDYDEFLFASEIAFRFLQRRDGVSLDQVLCDTDLRRKFDDIALKLAPHQSEFKLRMGALYLRKTHRLSPEGAGMPSYDFLRAGRIGEVSLEKLPAVAGMYVFYDNLRPVFAGETAKLRHRIGLHLEASRDQFLPSWLEFGGEDRLELKYMAVPNVKSGERVRWLNQFINRERPPFNYQFAA